MICLAMLTLHHSTYLSILVYISYTKITPNALIFKIKVKLIHIPLLYPSIHLSP